jgi:uncharacterized GH25 family protein
LTLESLLLQAAICGYSALTTNEFLFRLAGHVKHQGLPVVGVTVTLIDTFERSLAIGTERSGKRLDSKKTDAKGEFNFAVHPGTYRIQVAPSSSSRYVSQTIPEITVAANTTCNINLVTGKVLSGKVVDCHGKPVCEGALVAVGFESSTYLADCAVSQAGNYSLVVPGGKYHLAFQSSRKDVLEKEKALTGAGNYPSHHEVSLWPSSLAAKIGSVTVQADRQYDIALPKLFTLDGEVVDVNGDPVAGAMVVAFAREGLQSALGKNELASSSKTDAAGKFAFQLLAGVYDFAIEPDHSSELFGAKINQVEISQDCRKEFALLHGCVVKGMVYCADKPLSDCLVRIVALANNRELLTRTDSTGEFVINLSKGDYRFLVLAHPKDAPTKTINGIDYAGLAPASCLAAITSDQNIVFKLQEGTALFGKVTDDAGRPRPGVRVSAFLCDDFASIGNNLGRALVHGITDGEGHYGFFVSPASYWLVVHRDFANARKVNVQNEPLKVDIDWQGWCQLCLEVTGEDGAKIAHCRLRYSEYRVEGPGVDENLAANRESSEYTWLTSDEGICRLTLPVGIYTFEFLPPKEGSYEGRVLRQLSLSTDLTKKIVLSLKKSAGAQSQ